MDVFGHENPCMQLKVGGLLSFVEFFDKHLLDVVVAKELEPVLA